MTKIEEYRQAAEAAKAKGLAISNAKEAEEYIRISTEIVIDTVPALCEALEEYKIMVKMIGSAFAKECTVMELVAIITEFDTRINKILEADNA